MFFISMPLWLGIPIWILIAICNNSAAKKATALLRKCPECAETISREASICKHCRSTMTPVPVGIHRTFDGIQSALTLLMVRLYQGMIVVFPICPFSEATETQMNMSARH
jgi:hypothetical protein